MNDIPVIARRQLNTQVRLLDGEWAVVGGMLGSTDSKSTSGFWGLDQIPLIGNLFKQTTKDKERENLLIAIRPHLLFAASGSDRDAEGSGVGTETRPFTPL